MAVRSFLAALGGALPMLGDMAWRPKPRQSEFLIKIPGPLIASLYMRFYLAEIAQVLIANSLSEAALAPSRSGRA
jgi:hypothetical protein